MPKTQDEINAEVDKRVSNLETTRAVAIALAVIFGISGSYLLSQYEHARERLSQLNSDVENIKNRAQDLGAQYEILKTQIDLQEKSAVARIASAAQTEVSRETQARLSHYVQDSNMQLLSRSLGNWTDDVPYQISIDDPFRGDRNVTWGNCPNGEFVSSLATVFNNGLMQKESNAGVSHVVIVCRRLSTRWQ